MIVAGVICLLIGFIAAIPILWTAGIILVVVGLIFALVGSAHPVGGRRHYW